MSPRARLSYAVARDCLRLARRWRARGHLRAYQNALWLASVHRAIAREERRDNR